MVVEVTRLDLLPLEVITAIAFHLRPRPHASVYPHPQANSMDLSSVTIPSKSALHDLVALAQTCRACYQAALPALYYAPALLSNKQVRLFATSLAYKSSSEQETQHHSLRQPHHLFLPNDGLLMAHDEVTDQQEWAPSLRSIFRDSCARLDSVLLGARPDGAILSEFMGGQVTARPRRVTIFNFYSSPPFSLYNLSPLSRATHVHLIQLIPRDPLINFFSGQTQPQQQPSSHPHPLQVLRLSQLHSESLQDFAEYIRWRRASDEWNSLSSQERRGRGDGGPPPRPARAPARRFEAQETLYALATAAGPRLPAFRCLILELAELARLSEPEDMPLLGDGPAVDAADATVDGATGALQTTNQTVDGAGSGDAANDTAEAQRRQAAEDAERARTAARDAYWIQTREGKEALQELFEEARRDQAEAAEDGAADAADGWPPVEVRVVAPRQDGWSSDECRQDFEAQVAACALQGPTRISQQQQSSASASFNGDNDGTCYSDPDVFWLAEHRPWLSYHGATREEWERHGGSAGSTGIQRRRWWWTGSLPRVNAGAAAAGAGAGAATS